MYGNVFASKLSFAKIHSSPWKPTDVEVKPEKRQNKALTDKIEKRKRCYKERIVSFIYYPAL